MCSKHVFWVGIFRLINISSRSTRGNLSSPALLSLTSVYVPFSIAYILYLILEPVQACWIGSDISHNPSSSALLVNRTPTLGRPILWAAEVWRYGSGRALPNNLSKTSDQSLLSVCIGIGGATGYTMLRAQKIHWQDVMNPPAAATKWRPCR